MTRLLYICCLQLVFILSLLCYIKGRSLYLLVFSRHTHKIVEHAYMNSYAYKCTHTCISVYINKYTYTRQSSTHCNRHKPEDPYTNTHTYMYIQTYMHTHSTGKAVRIAPDTSPRIWGTAVVWDRQRGDIAEIRQCAQGIVCVCVCVRACVYVCMCVSLCVHVCV